MIAVGITILLGSMLFVFLITAAVVLITAVVIVILINCLGEGKLLPLRFNSFALFVFPS